MSVTGTPVSGTDGRVQYAGINTAAGKWTCTPKVGDIPSTNFESGGHEEGLTGVDVCEFEIELFFDKGNPPFQVLGLGVGNKTNQLKLYVSKTSNLFFNFPAWRCLETPVVQDVDNKKAMVTIRGKSDGPWFYP